MVKNPSFMMAIESGEIPDYVQLRRARLSHTPDHNLFVRTFGLASAPCAPMEEVVNGATRLILIVGDPIAQVKSPAGVTAALRAGGRNALVVPFHVRAENFATCMAGVAHARNVDGLIITVPHKFAAFDLCSTTSERSAFMHAVNTVRRNPDGSWHGDMFDGLAFIQAMRANGCDPAGKRALLVGAGGAGSAIAHALVDAGASLVAIHDPDLVRRGLLVNLLASLNRCRVQSGSSDPRDYDIVVNATPSGMHEGDLPPVQLDNLRASNYVGDVVTMPEITPLLAAARAAGCRSQNGIDMFNCGRDQMITFLLEA